MKPQLVFIHGRSQQGKDSDALKQEWINDWKKGLEKSGLQMPITEEQIRFPYYGDALHYMVMGLPPEVIEVIIKGAEGDDLERTFFESVMAEVREVAELTEAQLDAIEKTLVQEKGALNWPIVRKVLKAVDAYVPHGSGASIALATEDVYSYLTRQGTAAKIDDGVRKALTPGVPTVVVSHSLGTVVAYNILRRDGETLGLKVPLFVTVGSPLAVTDIRLRLQPLEFPSCVTAWYNAMDPRDIVALRPLDEKSFGRLEKEITNKVNVDNPTENRHGISGYLGDPEVARVIYDALVALS